MESRRLISWLLLGLLSAVGLGGAILGISLAPKNVPLDQAATNTLAAANYSEVVTENTAQGTQTDYLTYQAPDRLGGFIQSGNKRTYVYVIGSVQYQSVSVAANASTKNLVFYKQASQPASVVDPAHNYLRFASQAKNVTKNGNTYTFVLHQSGQTGNFSYTVNGSYVSSFGLTVQNASVHLVISQVGTSSPVNLPSGAKVVGAPPTSGSSGSAG
jgi:predicted membrane-bound mannosyltransferase